jgi:UDP-2,3-diacylglucosamine hydrolase
MTPAVPRFAELQAPANWRTADFLSDLHLQAAEPATAQAWMRYLETTAADAVFLLGDVFEVWVGDDAADDLDSFEHRCAQALSRLAARKPVFFMHGNRDFLVGAAFLARHGVTLLADPTVLVFGPTRWLLSHGDALCLDDVDYLRFRAEVREAPWQDAFLARPLAERRAIARGLREQSEARKRTDLAYADVDADEARAWLEQAGASTLIHGHTHKPAQHALGPGLRRVVLSDWDAQASPGRGDVLRLDVSGQLQRLPLEALR